MRYKQTPKYEIYVGLKDKETLKEVFSPDDFASILLKQCKNKKLGFSMTTQVGGYTHNKGYVTETSLRITLVGIDENDVNYLALKLKEIINTDTIMITKEKCNYMFM